jgi:hypothetical protein
MKRALLWLVTAAVAVASLLPNVGRAFFDPYANLQWLNVYGDHMFNYDMVEGSPANLDWPVGMIWGCQGNLGDVRSYMQSSLGPGYGPVGGSNYMCDWTQEDSWGTDPAWSCDTGNQTACYSGPDGGDCYSGDRCFRHTRTYSAETGSGDLENDHFYNTQ